TSAGGVPLSTWRRAYAICSSVNLDFFIGPHPLIRGPPTHRDSLLSTAHVFRGNVKLTPLVPLLTVNAQTGRKPRMSLENGTQAPNGKEGDTKRLENQELTNGNGKDGGEGGSRIAEPSWLQ